VRYIYRIMYTYKYISFSQDKKKYQKLSTVAKCAFIDIYYRKVYYKYIFN